MSLITKVQRHDAHRVTVALTGSLDTATAPELEKVLRPILDEKATRLVVFELAALRFLSSAGIRVLLAARKNLHAHDGVFAMQNAQPQIRKVFEVIEALPGFAIFKDDAELDNYLARLQKRIIDGD